MESSMNGTGAGTGGVLENMPDFGKTEQPDRREEVGRFFYRMVHDFVEAEIPEREKNKNWRCFINEEGKLTGKGREFAKILYAGMNFGGPEEVRERIEILREIRDDRRNEIKMLKRGRTSVSKNSDDYQLLSERIENGETEALFLSRLTASIEMQIRRNVVVGVVEEVKREDEKEYCLGDVVNYVVGNGTKQQKAFAEQAIAVKIAAERERMLGYFRSSGRSEIFEGLEESDLMELIRLAENDRIGEMLEGMESVNLGDWKARISEFVGSIYGDLKMMIERMEEFQRESDILRKTQVEMIKDEKGGRFRMLAGKVVQTTMSLVGAASTLWAAITGLGLDTKNVMAAEAERPKIVKDVQFADEEYARQIGLVIPAFDIKIEEKSEQVEVPVAERTRNVPEEIKKSCLSLVENENGTFWLYNKEAEDDALCKKWFPGYKLAGSILTKSQYEKTFPENGELEIPEEYLEEIKIGKFSGFHEVGNTCYLTTYASMLAYIRGRLELPAIQPWLLSDLLVSVNISEDQLQNRPLGSEGVKALNVFFVDTDKATIFNDFGVRLETGGDWFRGASFATREMKERYIRDNLEEIQGRIIMFYSKVFADEGIASLGSVVAEGVGHAVTVVGTGTEIKDGTPYLLVAEPNGGYAGWDYTNISKNSGKGWKVVGENGLVKIRLDVWNVTNIQEGSVVMYPATEEDRPVQVETKYYKEASIVESEEGGKRVKQISEKLAKGDFGNNVVVSSETVSIK